jgi:hypothetical protein
MKLKNVLDKWLTSQYCDVNPQPSRFGSIIYVPIYISFNKSNNVYYFLYCDILVKDFNYDSLVDKFIKMAYSDKEMFAIINNYLLDQTDEVALQEFNEMQEIRKEAKELAKHILSTYHLDDIK